MPRTWRPEHDLDARKMVDDALSRALDALTSEGRLSLSECLRDVHLELRHVPPGEIGERGDRRYSSDGLAEFLRKNPTLDLVPIIIGRGRGSPIVLDGHHRLRAYRATGRPALSLVLNIRPGHGHITFPDPALPSS